MSVFKVVGVHAAALDDGEATAAVLLDDDDEQAASAKDANNTVLTRRVFFIPYLSSRGHAVAPVTRGEPIRGKISHLGMCWGDPHGRVVEDSTRKRGGP